ncbi:MAG: hypothetical protein WC732_01105 [Candidatus Omnitrophota bacterium]
MRIRLWIFGLALAAAAGCANVCEFGRSSDSEKNVRCYGLMDAAKPGMTQKEVEKKIGFPDQRRFGISYMGKHYDEAWIYTTAAPKTILYFTNGILQEKDYQS